jgi:hypothetical protein
MSDYTFKGKVICGLCGWKMRGKLDRKKKIYICAKYNKNNQCVRNKIDEDFIISKIKELNIEGDTYNIMVNNGDIEIQKL